MVSRYFTHILYITGAITMLPLLQFFAPGAVLVQSGLQVGNSLGLLHAQHWGLMAFCFGALLIYAARHPNHRKPIVLAAGVEKLGLVGLIALGWNDPNLQGLHTLLWVNSVCVLLYAMWWWGQPNHPSSIN